MRYMAISERMMLKALKAMPPSNYAEISAVQLANYAEEYRRGTFAVGRATDVVERLTGQAPERFQSIAQRHVAQHPELKRTFGRRLGAMGGFLKMLLTVPPNPERVVRDLNLVEAATPRFCQDDAEWRSSHGNGSVFPIKSEVA